MARLSGDQFALLITKCADLSEILSAVYRLRRIWDEPMLVQGHELAVSCCVGLSVFPDDSERASEIMSHADSSQGVRVAGEFRQPLAQLAQELITGAQAQPVVDQLDVIDVEDGESNAASVALCMRDLAFENLLEDAPSTASSCP